MESESSVRSYRDLDVWALGMELAKQCHRESQNFPREEVFGFTSQMRRAAVSIPANIAEGWGRGTRGDYVRFLRISQGSLKELETHILLAQDLNMMDKDSAEQLLATADRIGRMLGALIRKLNTSPPN